MQWAAGPGRPEGRHCGRASEGISAWPGPGPFLGHQQSIGTQQAINTQCDKQCNKQHTHISICIYICIYVYFSLSVDIYIYICLSLSLYIYVYVEKVIKMMRTSEPPPDSA